MIRSNAPSRRKGRVWNGRTGNCVIPGSRDRRLRRARRAVNKLGLTDVRVGESNGAVLLEGSAQSWDQRVRAGYAVAKLGFRGVVNDLVVPDTPEQPMTEPTIRDDLLEGRQFDVVIIGAGVIGCAIARELTRWDMKIAVLDKEEDVGVHASSRNDGMVHPGLAPKPGSLKAYYNTRGNRMYDAVSEELGFPFRRRGSLALLEKRWMRLLVPVIKRRCRKNGVDGEVRYLSQRQVRQLEPNVTGRQHGALLMPSAGVVNPFEVTIAYAENAAQNGAQFFFETVVRGFEKGAAGEICRVVTNRGTLAANVVVNAAGVWSDRIAQAAGDRFFTIHGRRGVDAILDKRLSVTQHHILSMPQWLSSSDTHSKGGGLVTCVEGNLLAGPTSKETPGREDYATTPEELEALRHQLGLNRQVKPEDIITYFAGVRAATFEEDFIIKPSTGVPNLIHVVGIQSPGLASAPAIAVDVAAMAVRALEESACVEGAGADPAGGNASVADFSPRGSDAAEIAGTDGPLPAAGRPHQIAPNPHFTAIRRPRIRPAALPLAERAAIIRRDRAYGRIVCRCEEISEGEVRDALRSPLPVFSVDAVKRRTRAGAGRCHGGFCLPRVMEIIRQESGGSLVEVKKKGGDSWIASSRTKEQWTRVSTM